MKTKLLIFIIALLIFSFWTPVNQKKAIALMILDDGNSCSSFSGSCEQCLSLAPDSSGAYNTSACGWDGSSCLAGTSTCPVGGSQWNWISCSINVCTAVVPTPGGFTDCSKDDSAYTNDFDKPCSQYSDCATTDLCSGNKDYPYACYGDCEEIIPTDTPEPVDAPAFTSVCKTQGPNHTCAAVETAIGTIDTNPAVFVTFIFKVVLGLGGGIALILIILSGYRYMSSQGNPEGVKAATEQLTSAVVGLLFIIFAFVILQVIGVDILKIPGFS
jgi:hypothetical protein